MKKYSVVAKVVGSKYLGEFTGNSPEEVEDLAYKYVHVSLCQQCSRECENIEIEGFEIEEITE